MTYKLKKKHRINYCSYQIL